MNEELVLSGMSGRFPESDNVDELRDNLFAGKDLITEDDQRWPLGFQGLPRRMGKMKDITRFDAECFRINHNQAQNMNPMYRIILEVTYEAVVDAGYNPDSLRGRDIGVYVGIAMNDYTEGIHSDFDAINSHTTMGSLGNVLANRISYCFDWCGPSLVVDTACSSSLQALHIAHSDLMSGKVEMAIVGSANLILSPAVSIKFDKHRMLSKDGKTKFLDAAANGYVRSEAVCAVLLERRSTAKRIYGTLVNINSNNDGYKVEGISYPSSAAQIALMKKTLTEAKVRPQQIFYIETHGTGTPVGDQSEAHAIQEVYYKNRIEPVLVGSIKTNLGHSEGASGLCSLIKVLIAIQSSMIPPTINFTNPNPNIPGLMEGKIAPVLTNTELPNNSLLAVNSFGMGGTNVHLLIRPEPLPIDAKEQTEGIPRLITVYGRTESSVEQLLDFIDENRHKISDDFFALLDELNVGANGPTSKAMNYHGYMLYDQNNNEESDRDIQELPTDKREVWFVFSGMGCQWKNMVKGLMDLPIFAESMLKSAEHLKPFGIDLIDLVSVDEKQMFDSFIGSSVGITAMQIALVDILNALHIQWDGMVGHSAGEMVCAYAQGLMSAQQLILAKYYFAKTIQEADLPLGQMGAVGLTWEEAEQRCPANVYPACHNSENSVTISGLHSETINFMAQLKEEKVFAREVKSCGFSFHCPVLLFIEEKIAESLQSFIPRQKRSGKWLSTSWSTEHWATSEECQYSSPEYFANNSVAPVLFHQCIKLIPKDAIIIEIAPGSLFRNILSKSLGEEMSYVGLMKRNNGENNLSHLLSSIGQLYNLGLNPKVQNLYPKPQFPVKRGTQSISPLVKWDHSDQWFVPLFPKYFNSKGFANNSSNDSKVNLETTGVSLPKKDQGAQNTGHLVKINKIIGIRNAAKVKRGKRLRDFGMDSLMAVEIKHIIDEALGQDFPLDELPEMTYGHLLDLTNKLA